MSGSVYFVDDNFIAHRRAVRELLPHLIEWQKRNGYVFSFCCEATLNIAKRPEILELMREALFETVFCGIETPEPEALRAMSKDHNLMIPILDAVQTLNRYGMEVASGIILGLDTDTPDTGRHLVEFIEQSRIPIVTINLLQALPRTPLWDRLQGERRLVEDDGREFECGFPPTLRDGDRDLARLHGARLPAESGLCPLPAPGDRDLCQSTATTKQSAARILAQHPAGLAPAAPDPVGGGDA